jgi:hypothetical protein
MPETLKPGKNEPRATQFNTFVNEMSECFSDLEKPTLPEQVNLPHRSSKTKRELQEQSGEC